MDSYRRGSLPPNMPSAAARRGSAFAPAENPQRRASDELKAAVKCIAEASHNRGQRQRSDSIASVNPQEFARRLSMVMSTLHEQEHPDGQASQRHSVASSIAESIADSARSSIVGGAPLPAEPWSLAMTEDPDTEEYGDQVLG